MRYYPLFLLFLLTGCMANRLLTGEKALDSHYSVPAGDTLTIVLPDSLPVHTAPNTTVLSRLFAGKKIKNSTIIIQTGAGSVASPIGKAKAPVAVAAGEASATALDKTKAPVVLTTGNNSPATATTTTKNYSWLVWLLVAGLLGLGYYRYQS